MQFYHTKVPRQQDGNNPRHNAQQPGGDGDDVGHRVFSGDVLAGFGDVAEDIAVDDSAEDEVNMADQDER